MSLVGSLYIVVESMIWSGRDGEINLLRDERGEFWGIVSQESIIFSQISFYGKQNLEVIETA